MVCCSARSHRSSPGAEAAWIPRAGGRGGGGRAAARRGLTSAGGGACPRVSWLGASLPAAAILRCPVPGCGSVGPAPMAGAPGGDSPGSAARRLYSRMEASCLELALEGERLCKAGDFKAGAAFFEAAVQVGTEDLKTLSAIYSQLGNAYFYLKEYSKALEYHKHDLTLAR
uniref:G protein signaling modulator 1 n=2 Tax=Coturnix japonica TaxID=93934 RepID=A0A8C2T7A1_COTJA